MNIELNFPPKLRGARSRLYRRRFLQVNTRWKALAEIYTMHSFAPFWNPLFPFFWPGIFFFEGTGQKRRFSRKIWKSNRFGIHWRKMGKKGPGQNNPEKEEN